VAGVKRMRAEGKIGPGERVVAVLTGHLLKDPGAIMETAARSIEIRASVADLRDALSN
jgi:threonine synthase